VSTVGATVEVLPEPEEARAAATGAVVSIQDAELSLPGAEPAELWREETLERLAHAYWLYLQRASRGLIRVVYGERSRTVVLGAGWPPLLRFGVPEYGVTEDGGAVCWPIDRGLLVAREGRGSGWLRIAVARDSGASRDSAPDGEARVRIRVEVRNFYPWLRGRGAFARLGVWIYSQTQLRIHRRIALGFLRSLALLELPPPRTAPNAGDGL
jgi:hypothetical protein